MNIMLLFTNTQVQTEGVTVVIFVGTVDILLESILERLTSP
jgi:hypothetical protein